MDQTISMAGRSITVQVEIDAAPARVWQALTDSIELTRWFAPDAECRPGPSGMIRLSWGGHHVAKWQIVTWQPEVCLRAVEVRPFSGVCQSPGGPQGSLEFQLAPCGAGTLLCLKHGGFPANPGLIGIVRRGWEFELESLRHYLERHANRPRETIWVVRTSLESTDETWRQIVSSFAVSGISAGCKQGAPFMMRADGGPLAGRLMIYEPPYQLVATLAPYRDALFRIKLAEQAGGAVEANAWLSAWGVARPVIEEFGRRCEMLLDRLPTIERGAFAGTLDARIAGDVNPRRAAAVRRSADGSFRSAKTR